MYALGEVLLAESVDKIIRMEAFLDDVMGYASEDDINIIKYYQSIIKLIKIDLIDPAEELKLHHGKDTTREILIPCVNKCLRVFLRIKKLHILLGYVPSIQARTEIYTFAKSLLKEIPSIKDKKLELSIVLSDIYNYEEINIGKTLNEAGVVGQTIPEDRVILELPKLEKDNPLMWAILVHEIGHMLDNNYLKVTEQIFTDINLPSKQLRVLKNWTKEIVSDMISLRIMGPSYLMSFMFFNLLLGDVETYSTTHPSAKYRISLMESKLKDYEFGTEDINDILKLVEEIQTFEYNLDTNYCPECGNELKQNIPKKLTKKFNTIVDKVINKIDDINLNQFTTENNHRSEILSSFFKDRIPISSSRKVDDGELRKLCKSFKKNQDNIYDLLKRFEEKPNLISEIINAGWIHKTKYAFPVFVKLFFENDDDFDKKYEAYRKFLNQNDNLLLKSIEIADIHSLFEIGRGLP